MKQFFKFMFASALGTILVIVLLLLFMFASLAAVVSSVNTSTPNIRSKSVLYLDFKKPVYDRQVENLSMLGSSSTSSIGMYELIKMIETAKTDDNIKGIYLDLSYIQANGWATIEEIRNALLDFKESKKFIYAYGDMYMQNAYYLSTVADKIGMNPAGHLVLQGLGAEVVYLKDLLDKFDVNVDLIRPKNNAYKSAGEMFLLNKMSNANREQIRTYISSIWNHVSQQMATERGIDFDTLQKRVDNLDGFMAEDALRARFVDTLCFESDMHMLIKQKIGADKDDKINFVSYKQYKDYLALNPQNKNKSKNAIAVIYAYGSVEQGKGSDLVIGSETIAKAIRKAAAKDNVKAIVLRVNSGGGDAIASEIMTHEIVKAKQKKPVIVSMGDVAASAGYEIASNATKIVALPTTITGSIGVFGVMPEFGTALKKHLGIFFDTVGTNANSHFFSTMRPMKAQAREVMQRNVEEFYVNFCHRVSIGRNLSMDFVDSIARGRVWSGADAKKIGLIDEFGGLISAINLAAKEAKTDDYKVVSMPAVKTMQQQIMELISDDGETLVSMKMKEKPYRWLLEMESWTKMSGVQARLPYIISLN